MRGQTCLTEADRPGAERKPEDVAQDLDLPDESAEQVRGGREKIRKLARRSRHPA